MQPMVKLVLVIKFGLVIFLSSDYIEATSVVDGEYEGSCPTWYVFNNATDRCLCHGFKDWVICNEEDQRVRLADGLCTTFDNETGDTDVGMCPYMVFNRQHEKLLESGYLVLPENISDLNEFMCGPLNREGYLCHKCKPGYGLTIANVFQTCIKCKFSKGVGWLFYFMVQLIPLTILFFVISVFRISLARPPMRAFVFFYQLAASVVFTHIYRFYPPFVANSHALRRIHHLSVVIFGIWGMSLTENIHGLTDFCVDPNINTQQAFTLKQIQSTFPLLLVTLTYACIQLHARNCRFIVWLWRPFHRCFARCIKLWNPKLSAVDVFSTFLLLSYSRYNIELYFLLSVQRTYSATTGEWNRTSVLLYNPAVPYFHPVYHLPYSLILLFIFLMVAVPPVLLLAFYQTSSFQKALAYIRLNNFPSIHIFVDLFQGCYKDGTNGTYDLRFTASLYLIATVVIMICFSGCNYTMHGNCKAMSVFTWTLLLLLFFALVKPYKNQVMNVLDSLLLASLAVINLLLVSTSHTFEYKTFNLIVLIAILVVIAIPHMILFGYLFYKLFNRVYKLKCSQLKVRSIEVSESLPDRIDNSYRDESF